MKYLEVGDRMKEESLAVFEGKQIRRYYGEDTETLYFSVVDIIQVLIQQPDYQAARNYWKVLKNRLNKEGSQSVTKCHRLKMEAADNISTTLRKAEEKRAGRKTVKMISIAMQKMRDIPAMKSPAAKAGQDHANLLRANSGVLTRGAIWIIEGLDK